LYHGDDLRIGSKLCQALFRENFQAKGVPGVSCRVLDCLPDVAHSAAKPQPKEFNRGFHGFHGLEMISDQTTLIRVIRAIRGKIFAERSDLWHIAGQQDRAKEGTPAEMGRPLPGNFMHLTKRQHSGAPACSRLCTRDDAESRLKIGARALENERA
jgi:hypothetical protein